LNGQYLPGGKWYSSYFIQQESTFWKRSLWEKSGASLNTSLQFAGDFDLWLKFYLNTDLYVITTSLGGMRSHDNQKSVLNFTNYINEAVAVLNKNGFKPYNSIQTIIRKFIFLFANRIFIPKSYLPKFLYYLLIKSKLFYNTKRVSWRNNNWILIEGLIF
jgi:hypothetical protein